MKRLFNKKKADNYEGSSEHLKKEESLNKKIDLRLRIFIVTLIMLASVLIYRLYDVQILDADHYENLLEKSQSPGIGMATMRGDFLDRNGNTIVSNKAINSITYYPPRGSTNESEWEVAKNFVDNFDVEEDLNENDLKVLWLFLNDNGEELVTEEEKEENSRDNLENLKLERITDEMLDTISINEKKAFKVYVAMGSSTSSQTAIVIEDASADDIAFLSENINHFPGFSFNTNWEREHTGDINISSLIGNVSDISSEKLDYYLASGYQLNDKVGSYGLEFEYEEFLSGVKSEYTLRGRDHHFELNKEGEKGLDLVMSLDTTIQKSVEKTLSETIESTKDNPRREPFKEMHMVVSDPNNGDILGLAAMKRDSKGGYYNEPQSLILDGFPLGSTIKGATVYMGLDQGVMKEGEIIIDKPMHIQGTKPRTSFRNLGPVDDVKALELSSNIYMFEVAIRLANSEYIPNGPLRIENPNDTFNLMRNYYSRFGLGVKTQIDYPREEQAYKGSTLQGGSLLDFSIGQYDNYNALQLNQYISTIANGGYRLKPRLVKEAINRDSQSVVHENEVEILNILDNEKAINRVREGMRRCVVTGNCGPIQSSKYTSGAKTGTAQDFMAEYEDTVRHNTFVAFAPFEEPEIAVSCIAPYTYIENGPAMTNLCTSATEKVIDEYMNNK